MTNSSEKLELLQIVSFCCPAAQSGKRQTKGLPGVLHIALNHKNAIAFGNWFG